MTDQYLGAEVDDPDYLRTRLKAVEELLTEVLRAEPALAHRLRAALDAPRPDGEPLSAGAVVAAKIGIVRRALDPNWTF